MCYSDREFEIFLATRGEFLLPRLLAPPFEIPGKFSRYEIAHRRKRVGFFISFAYLYATMGFSGFTLLRPLCPRFHAHARVLLESGLTPKFPLRFSKPPLTTPVLVNTRESFKNKELWDSYGFVSEVRPHALTMFEGSKWAWGRNDTLKTICDGRSKN